MCINGLCRTWMISTYYFYFYWPLFIHVPNVMESQGLICKRNLFWESGARWWALQKATNKEGIQTPRRRVHWGAACRDLRRHVTFISLPELKLIKLLLHMSPVCFPHQVLWTPTNRPIWQIRCPPSLTPPKKKFSLRPCDPRFSTGWQCGPLVLCGASSPAGLTLHIQYELLCALVAGQWNLRYRLVLPVRGHTHTHTALVTGFGCKVNSGTLAFSLSLSVWAFHTHKYCVSIGIKKRHKKKKDLI